MKGQVSFAVYLTEMKSKCKMILQRFPYDSQTCTIIFTSFSYNSEFIKYNSSSDNIYRSSFSTENQIWSIIGLDFEAKNILYENDIYSFSELNIRLSVKRKPLFVILNILTPAFFLSIITLVAFYIPFQQAMTIGTSVFLAYSVLNVR